MSTSTTSKLVGGAYRRILKPILFMQDPENVHDRMVRLGAFLGNHDLGRSVVRRVFDYGNPILEQDVCGLHFKNPVGLAAGFDKNAELTDILPSVGFGFVEVGSITGERCEGNSKPRLWRLPKSRSLLVYYGLKNDGCDILAPKLEGKISANHGAVIGTSVAMTNCMANTDAHQAVKDYAKAFKKFAKIGDYTTINISCPNAYGGQPFLTPHKLDYLLDILDEIPTEKPVFIKLSPDMSDAEVDAILAVAEKHRVNGIICTNLMKKRDPNAIKDADVPLVGGFSGKLVQDYADALLKRIYRKFGSRFVLVGCGGIFSAEDAYRKIRNGASLVQLVTGMIFEGPQLIGDINRGLVESLEKDGFKSIKEAVGADLRQSGI